MQLFLTLASKYATHSLICYSLVCNFWRLHVPYRPLNLWCTSSAALNDWWFYGRMEGWNGVHTHTACIHITNCTMYYMHVICVCCASNQWVLTESSLGMDDWGSLQKNHVCLSVMSLGLVIAKAHWSSNLVCLSPVSTTAITAATMGHVCMKS